MPRRIFFSEELQEYVVDSMCSCGHLESEHGSKLLPLQNKLKLRLPHEGNCCSGKCKCPKFHWARWVTVIEKATFVKENGLASV